MAGFFPGAVVSGSMRVAFVSFRTTHHGDAPGARRLERVARMLAGRGHEVTVFCDQWWGGEMVQSFVDGPIEYHRVSVGGRWSFRVGLPFALAGHRPDIVHARPSPPQLGAAHWGARLARVPFVVDWFGDEQTGEGFTGTSTRRPDRLLVPSQLVWTRACQRGADGDRTEIVPESIEFERLDGVDPDPDVDLVYAHPLDEHANLDQFLLALAELRSRGWHATVVGDGPRREEYEQMARELRIGDRVDFTGACDRDRRLELYRGAHVFVQTATRELFATELLWALACGCVGIVEYQAGSSAHELVESYPRSFRVTSPAELADAIAEAGDLETMDREESWQSYDSDAVVEQYLDVYRELL
jgi:glycosyltransferase involved in cell wall biosynthesis